MPFLKGISNNYQFQINTNFKSLIGHWKFDIRNLKFQSGFTLIELLVVIAIFGLTASLITASYLTFERNQRLKNAALMIKSDMRLVADKAFSGDKGVNTGPNTYCSTSSTPPLSKLIGWYIRFKSNTGENTSYSMAGDCRTNISEVNFNLKSVNLPKDVKICEISYGAFNPTNVNVLFRPLSHDVYINDGANTPPFIDVTTGELKAPYSGSDLIIILGLKCPASEGYRVIINSAGEAREQKF